MNITKELSDSLLAACKAAGIEKPKFIAQDENGLVFHLWLGSKTIRLNHPPYADDWQDSLLEWVDHIADTRKKVDDALVWKGSSDD